MHPVAFTLGPLVVYSYPLAFAAACVVARMMLGATGARSGIRPRQATDLTLAAALGGIVGARAWYVVAFPAAFVAHPLRILELQSGGLVFYGGLAGGAIAVALLVRFLGLEPLRVADGAAFALPPAMAIGRLGCLCAGCCGGPGLAAGGVTVPPQLVDAAAELLFLGGLLVLAGVLRRPGSLASAWLAGYAGLRFGIEYLRGDPRLVAGLTTAQVVSLALVPLGVAGVLLTSGRTARATVSRRDAA